MKPCLSLCALLLLAGCAAGAPAGGPPFGAAVRQALASQVLAPDAAIHAAPLAGIDGHAAAAVQLRYVKSFSEPVPAPAGFTIGAAGAK